MTEIYTKRSSSAWTRRLRRRSTRREYVAEALGIGPGDLQCCCRNRPWRANLACCLRGTGAEVTAVNAYRTVIGKGGDPCPLRCGKAKSTPSPSPSHRRALLRQAAGVRRRNKGHARRHLHRLHRPAHRRNGGTTASTSASCPNSTRLPVWCRPSTTTSAGEQNEWSAGESTLRRSAFMPERISDFHPGTCRIAARCYNPPDGEVA